MFCSTSELNVCPVLQEDQGVKLGLPLATALRNLLLPLIVPVKELREFLSASYPPQRTNRCEEFLGMERHSEASKQPLFKRKPACSARRVSPLPKHLSGCISSFHPLVLLKQGMEPEIVTGNTAGKVGLKARRGRLRAGTGVRFVVVFENGSV